MNEVVKNTIRWWLHKVKDEEDPFIRFFMYYMCFDAWITAESQLDIDTLKLKWLYGTDNDVIKLASNFWQVPENLADLNNLKNLCPVGDMRIHPQDKSKTINDIENTEQVVGVIYQIRCNLFHGAKNPSEARDEQLVIYAGNILERWLNSGGF